MAPKAMINHSNMNLFNLTFHTKFRNFKPNDIFRRLILFYIVKTLKIHI